MAALRLAPFAGTQGRDQNTLRVRQERVRQVFLDIHISIMPRNSTMVAKADLGLPLTLRRGLVGAQTVYVEVERCEIGVYVTEATGLLRATRCKPAPLRHQLAMRLQLTTHGCRPLAPGRK